MRNFHPPLVNTHLIHTTDFPEIQFYVSEDLLVCSGILSVMICVYRDRRIFSLSLSICEKGAIQLIKKPSSSCLCEIGSLKYKREAKDWSRLESWGKKSISDYIGYIMIMINLLLQKRTVFLLGMAKNPIINYGKCFATLCQQGATVTSQKQSKEAAY